MEFLGSGTLGLCGDELMIAGQRKLHIKGVQSMRLYSVPSRNVNAITYVPPATGTACPPCPRVSLSAPAQCARDRPRHTLKRRLTSCNGQKRSHFQKSPYIQWQMTYKHKKILRSYACSFKRTSVSSRWCLAAVGFSQAMTRENMSIHPRSAIHDSSRRRCCRVWRPPSHMTASKPQAD